MMYFPCCLSITTVAIITTTVFLWQPQLFGADFNLSELLSSWGFAGPVPEEVPTELPIRLDHQGRVVRSIAELDMDPFWKDMVRVRYLHENGANRPRRDDLSIFTMRTQSHSVATAVKPIAQQHVLFENFGKLVGAISYIHLEVDLQYDELLRQISLFEDMLNKVCQRISQEKQALKGNQSEEQYQVKLQLLDYPILSHDLRPLLAAEEVMELERQALTRLQARVSLLQQLLPVAPEDQEQWIQDQKDRVRELRKLKHQRDLMNQGLSEERVQEVLEEEEKNGTNLQREKRAFFLAPLIAGVIMAGTLGTTGTILGSFNQADINRLGEQVQTLKDNQEKLVQVVADQEKVLQQIQANLNSLILGYEGLIRYNPGLLHARFASQRELLTTKLDQIFDVVKTAELQRLAPELLSERELLQAYKMLEEESTYQELELVPFAPGHIFQLDASLLRRSRSNIAVMVHVPMVNKDQVFNLYKYHPVPFVFQDDTAIVVNAPEGFIAVGDGNLTGSTPAAPLDLSSRANLVKRHIALTLEELQKCRKFRDIFLCEEQGASITNPGMTCLGSIFTTQESEVRRRCPIRTSEKEEMVYQMSTNSFVLFTPRPLAVDIRCKHNRTTKHIDGHARLDMGPGCQLQLMDHFLEVGTNVRIKAEVTEFKWDWNPLSKFEGIPRDVIYRGLREVNQQHANGVLLEDLQRQLQAMHVGRQNWDFHSAFTFGGFSLGLFAILACILSLLIYCCRQRRLRKWAKEYLLGDEPIEVLQMSELDPQLEPPIIRRHLSPLGRTRSGSQTSGRYVRAPSLDPSSETATCTTYASSPV